MSTRCFERHRGCRRRCTRRRRRRLETVASTYEEVLEELGGDLEGDDFLDPDNAEAFEPLSSEEFTEANEVVTAYLDEICAAPGG